MLSIIYSVWIVLLTLGVTTSSFHVMNYILTYRSQKEQDSFIAHSHLSRKQGWKSTRIWFRMTSLPITKRMWTCNILLSTKSKSVVPIIIVPHITILQSVLISATTLNNSSTWERFESSLFLVIDVATRRRMNET